MTRSRTVWSPISKAAFLSLFIALPGTTIFSERLTPERLWELGRLSDPQSSPDGQRVVYGVSLYDIGKNQGDRDLYVISSRGGEPRRITAFQGNEFNARWRPDGRRIGFLSGASDSVQLWEMNPDGSDKSRVTDIEGGISNFLYAPSGKHVSFTRNIKLDQTASDRHPDLPRADARIIDSLMFRHWDSWHDYAYSHLFVAPYRDGKIGEARDLMESERFDTPLNPFGGVEQINWSPDGRILAYTCKKNSGTAYTQSTNSDIYLYDVESRETRNASSANPGYDIEPVFHPDGHRLFWLSMATAGYEADRQRLVEYDLGSGNLRELSAGLDQNVSHLLPAGDQTTLFFISETKGTAQVYALDTGSGKVRQITRGQHDYTSIQRGSDSRSLTASRMSMSSPAELYRVDVVSGKAVGLTSTNRERLQNLELGKVEERWVDTTDGKRMLVWVIFPPDFDPARRYPTILYCQGGPQSTVSQFFSYRWNFQIMAANGYIVVAPNRRGLPSFGQAWNDAIAGDWGGQAMQDYLSAIDHVAAEPYVDQTRLGAVGASFGGYSVFYLAGHHEKRFKAFIAHAGVFNLESMFGATEEIFFVNHDLEGPYWLDPTPVSYAAFSPHRYVQNWDTPILIIHSQKDFRVPVTESMQAFTAAQLRGVPSRFVYFPDESHWILSPQNGILWQRLFFDWLDRYLR